MNLSVFQHTGFKPASYQADQARISDSMFDETEQPSMIKTPERRHDTLPISKTFRGRLPSSGNVIRLKAKRCKYSGLSTDKVEHTCLLLCPMKAER